MDESKKVILYRTFDSPGEFMNWQLEKDRQIIQIQYYPRSVNVTGGEKENKVEAGGNLTHSIFVTFWHHIATHQ